jgi:hypothetical protein
LESNNNSKNPTPTSKIIPLTNGPYYLINDMEPKVVENLQNSKEQLLQLSEVWHCVDAVHQIISRFVMAHIQ